MYEQQEFDFCKPHLVNGEYILWQGKPAKGNLLTPADIFQIPFSIFWCGFVFFWEFGVLTSGAPVQFALFGLPFICVGIYLVIGRFIWTAWIRKRTRYVITNKKVIRARCGRVDMMDGRTMPPVQTHIYKNGCGTLRFALMNPYHRGGNSMSAGWSGEGGFALENVEEPAKVQQFLSAMDR
jgi:hypothetical protein